MDVSGRSPLPKTFFQDRISDERDGHIKVFGKDCMLAVKVLGLFCKDILVPSNCMLDHCRCMQLLCDITYMLESGDRVVQNVDILRQKAQEHRNLYVQLHGLKMTKPKLHLFGHVPRNIELHGVNLDTRACEWKHGLTKQSRIPLKGSTEEHGALYRLLFEMLEDMSHCDFSPNCLINPRDAPTELRPCIQEAIPELGYAIKASKRMHAEAGEMKVGVFLQMLDDSHGMICGKSLLFVGGTSLNNGHHICFVIFEKYEQVGPDEWTPSYMAIAPAEAVQRSLGFAEKGGNNVRLIIPPMPL